MAFGARQDDDKSWRLCLRKGRIIRHAGGHPIKFSSQAKAKACADALNEKFWDRNKKELTMEKYPPDGEAMFELIKEFAI